MGLGIACTTMAIPSKAIRKFLSILFIYKSKKKDIFSRKKSKEVSKQYLNKTLEARDKEGGCILHVMPNISYEYIHIRISGKCMRHLFVIVVVKQMNAVYRTMPPTYLDIGRYTKCFH